MLEVLMHSVTHDHEFSVDYIFIGLMQSFSVMFLKCLKILDFLQKCVCVKNANSFVGSGDPSSYSISKYIRNQKALV